MDEILQTYKDKILKGIGHLEYSYKKISKLTTEPSKLSDDELDRWESFCSRFSRVADLFLTKYIRRKVLLDDPGFEGSFRDYLDRAEKLSVIESADYWQDIRSLRNINAHEYTEEDLQNFYHRVRKSARVVIDLKNKL